ncbi:MAG: winged helix-turn-helix domain-containing protein [Gammaproteobacteria bacterium]|nr:winged helix-turn-helix domain-containing protein [Gammaproteobacteria bacterium]
MTELPSSQTESKQEHDLFDDWSAHPIQIGDCVIDFNEKTVTTESGEVRNITPNSIRLLLLLLENSNSYVSLNDIHKFIYGNQYKDDSSTRKQVTVLRKLFDDTDKEKKYIENKLGHGYRLIAPVQFLDDDIIAGLPIKDKYFWALGAFIAASVSVFLFGWYWFDGFRESMRGAVMQQEYETAMPLSHFKGIENYPSISADQRWMLFNHKPEGQVFWQVYVRDMKTGDLIKLSQGDRYERLPRWTAKNKFIFSRFEDQACHFYIASFDAVKRAVVDERQLVACNTFSQTAQGHLWNDEQGMYFNRAKSVNEPFIIYSHSFSSGESWPIASPPPSGKGDYYFSVSQDGLSLAVLRNKNWSQTEVWLYDTRTWETQLIETVDSVLHTVEWFGNEKIIFKNDSNEILEYDVTRGFISILTRAETPILAPMVLKDGSLVYASGSYFKSDLLQHYLSQEKVEKVESSSYQDFLPAVSMDGMQLAWVSNRSGVYQVWIRDEQGHSRQLTYLKNNLKFTDLSFSPNSQFLGGTASGRWFIIDNESNEIIWGDQNRYYKNFQWRRDSTSAFVAVKHMEQWEQTVIGINGEYDEVPKLPNDAFIVLEAPGTELTYVANFKINGFWRVPQDPEAEKVFFPVEQSINKTGRWSATDQGLYFTQNDTLYFLAHDSQQIQLIDRDLNGSRISVPNHGQWYIGTQTLEGEVDLLLLAPKAPKK